MSKIKRLRVFAGPNGSGKSTLFETISSKFYVGNLMNSDLIEREIYKRVLLILNDMV